MELRRFIENMVLKDTHIGPVKFTKPGETTSTSGQEWFTESDDSELWILSQDTSQWLAIRENGQASRD